MLKPSARYRWKGGIISFIFYNNTMVWFSSRKKVTAQSLKNAGFFYPLKNQSFTKKHVPPIEFVILRYLFYYPCMWTWKRVVTRENPIHNLFYTGLFSQGLKGGAVWGPISEKKFFSPNWLIFGIWGFSGMRNRLAQVPSSKKIFMTPYRG